MATAPMRVMLFAAAGVAVAVSLAPLAAAEPTATPTGPASTEIDNLAKQGYNVELNWANGTYGAPLDKCTVTHVDTPAKNIAAVDISCPAA